MSQTPLTNTQIHLCVDGWQEGDRTIHMRWQSACINLNRMVGSA